MNHQVCTSTLELQIQSIVRRFIYWQPISFYLGYQTEVTVYFISDVLGRFHLSTVKQQFFPFLFLFPNVVIAERLALVFTLHKLLCQAIVRVYGGGVHVLLFPAKFPHVLLFPLENRHISLSFEGIFFRLKVNFNPHIFEE